MADVDFLIKILRIFIGKDLLENVYIMTEICIFNGKIKNLKNIICQKNGVLNFQGCKNIFEKSQSKDIFEKSQSKDIFEKSHLKIRMYK